MSSCEEQRVATLSLIILWTGKQNLKFIFTHMGSSWDNPGRPSKPSSMLITIVPGIHDGPVLWKRTLSWEDMTYYSFKTWESHTFMEIPFTEKIWHITCIAFAVLKRKSGEEYLICNRFKKLSKAARMWLFWGLKEGFTNLGLIL